MQQKTDNDRNSGTIAEERDSRGRFVQGNAGRPLGTRHRITRAAEALLEGETEALTRKAITMALEGDTTALRLCLERILPPMKSRPAQVDLPDVVTGLDGLKALTVLLRATAAGDVTPDEAQALAGLLEAHRKELEIVAIEERLARLEEAATRK